MDRPTDRRPSLLHHLSWCGSGIPAQPDSCRRQSSVLAPELEEIPGDALKPRIEELAEFEKRLGSLTAFSREVASAGRRLAAAPAELLAGLDGVALCSSTGQPLLPPLSKQLEAWSARLQANADHLDAIEQLAGGVRERTASANLKLHERLEAWRPKARADSEASALKQRFGRNFSLEEKKARLQAKHQMDESFIKLTEESSQALDDALAQRGTAVGGMLAELCLYVSGAFGGSQQLANEFGKLAKQLASSRLPAGGSSAAAAAATATTAAAAPPAADPSTAAAPSPAEEDASGHPSAASGSAPPLLPGTRSRSEGRLRGQLTKLFTAAGGGSTATSVSGYGPGDAVEVWSSSESAWIRAVVENVFASDSVDDGFKVPAGVVKVAHHKGKKYVRPEQLASELRRLGPGSPEEGG